jgi:hypothetical protein
LCDAFQVPKPLSSQLQPFGKSDDDLGELTFEVGLFSCSVRKGRTVRLGSADGPRGSCSSRVRRVLVRLCFRSGLSFGFGCSQFADGPRSSSGRSVGGADGPPGLGGRSVFPGSLLVVLCALTDGPWCWAGRSAVLSRTVRGLRSDSPRGLRGRAAPPGRTVRQSLCALLLGSIPPFPF